MKSTMLKIHNFRSFQDISVDIRSYSILLGINNSGKSNLIDAIRIFYDKDIKYDEERDFPKFVTKDDESWVEIEFTLDENEVIFLNDKYKSEDRRLLIRKYFKSSEIGKDGKTKSGFFGYVNGQLSDNKFTWNNNTAHVSFGEIVYIPAVSKIDDHIKMSGPSPLRDLINSVLNKILLSSSAYEKLNHSIKQFSLEIKNIETENGYSIDSIEKDISNEINNWGANFSFIINNLEPDIITKSLIDFKINDNHLEQLQDLKSYGQGFQRNLIYSLIKLSAKYNSINRTTDMKDYSPQLTWFLFEEPEVYLHPSQIEVLNNSLRIISKAINQQVLITTHNSIFVSKNIEDIPSLIRLYKIENKSNYGQLSNDDVREIFELNIEEINRWLEVPELNKMISKEDLNFDMEAIKYLLWLDPRRCNVFFAKKVLIVEGPTEVAVINYLIESRNLLPFENGVFILDSMGKFNIVVSNF